MVDVTQFAQNDRVGPFFHTYIQFNEHCQNYKHAAVTDRNGIEMRPGKSGHN